MHSGSSPTAPGYDPNVYWENTESSYPHYPTVRHRKRFILNQLKRVLKPGESTVLDYGCGEGTLLQTIGEKFQLSADQLAGCDISAKAVEIARRNVKSSLLFEGVFPHIDQTFDAAICSEVLEHTTEYRTIIRWLAEHLSPGGTMILTTQAGRIHASDIYTAHTQHFRLRELSELVRAEKLEIVSQRLWGFPLFTLQKYLTNIRFDKIRKNYLDGALSFRKRFVFQSAYLAYFAHDLIPFGPQIYLVARRPK